MIEGAEIPRAESEWAIEQVEGPECQRTTLTATEILRRT